MKLEIKSMVLLLVIISMPGYLYAQKADSAIAELQKIQKRYTASALNYVAGKMTLKNTADNKIVDKVDFEYWIKGKKIAAVMGYIEILVNDEVYIMVNNQQKTIYGRLLSQLQQKPSAGFFDPQMLTKFLTAKNTAAILKKEGDYNSLLISAPSDSKFASVKIRYTPGNYRIISIDATVAATADTGEMILQVVYNTAGKDKLAAGDEKFSAGKYIEKTNKSNYTYTKQYKSYQKL